MTETPEEMYKRLTQTTWPTLEEAIDEFQTNEYKLIDAMKLLNHYRNQVEVLLDIIDEYAGQHGLDAAKAAITDKWSE